MEFDFEKHAVVESMDTVPEKYKALYTPIEDGDDAGKFTVGEAFKGIVGDYTGTAKALGLSRNDKTKASDESAKRRIALKGYEDIMEALGIEEDSRTAEGLKAYVDEIADQAKNGKELKINIDKIREEMSKKHAIELEGKDAEISKRDTALSKHLISNVATLALAEAKGSVDLLLPHVKDNTKVVVAESGEYEVRVLDSAGEVRFNGAGNPLTVGELVTSMKADEKFARAFESETPGGGGAKPGSTSMKGTGSVRDMSAEKSATDKISSGLSNRNRK